MWKLSYFDFKNSTFKDFEFFNFASIQVPYLLNLSKFVELNNSLVNKFVLTWDQTSFDKIDTCISKSFLDLEIILSSSGQTVDFKILLLSTQKISFRLNLLLKHLAPKTKANVVSKAVLDDGAKLDFLGYIYVAKQAQKTTTALLTKSLLLSSNSQVKALPYLQIFNKDIDCKHGATISNLEQVKLNYLLSKGISNLQAKNFLIDSFLYYV